MTIFECFLLFPNTNLSGKSIFEDKPDLVENPQKQPSQFLKNAENLIDRAEREERTRFFYDAAEIEQFLGDWEKDYIGLRDGLIELLANATQIPVHSSKDNTWIFVWHIEKLEQNGMPESFHVDLKAPIFKAIYQTPNHPVIVSLESISEKYTFVTLIADEFDQHKKPELKNISVVHNEQQLDQYFIEKRTPRSFKPSPKHGENGQSAWADSRGNSVEVLLCSRNEAQELLHKALSEKPAGKKSYNFDLIHQRYIVYYYEGETPSNMFHGFHLENHEDVPQEIREVLGRLGRIS